MHNLPAVVKQCQIAALALVLIGCDSSLAACPQSPASITHALVKLFANSTLSTDKAGALLDSDRAVTRHGDYWQLKSKACRIEFILPAKAKDKPLQEAEVRLRLEAGLQLHDLEEEFGPATTVFSSKTSSVSFRIPGTHGGRVVAFARLYTSDIKPDSVVTNLQLRRSAEGN